MARKPTGRPNGRPKIEINNDSFKKLCELHCTKEEIAGFFNCTEETIDNYCKREHGESFLGVFKRLSVGGKMSLRRYQFELAKHNATMAIFLGKNLLGQTDNQDISLSGKNGEKSVVEFVFKDTAINEDEDNDSENI